MIALLLYGSNKILREDVTAYDYYKALQTANIMMKVWKFIVRLPVKGTKCYKGI